MMWSILTKFFRRTIFLICILNSIALILSLISPYIPIKDNSLVSTFGLFFPFFFIINCFILLLFIFLRQKITWFVVLLLLISLPAFTRIFGFHFQESISPIDCTVASFNMQFSKPIALMPSTDAEYHMSLFSKELSEHDDIDIMAVQEYGDLSRSILKTALDFKHEHTAVDKTVSILSKHPILAAGMVDFNSNVANTCMWADVIVGFDTLRIYSYHLESNRHDGNIPKTIHQDTREVKSLSVMVGIVKYYNGFSNTRYKQAQLIVEHASQCDYPIILCGDLNDTPQSYLYDYIREHYADAFLQRGWGSGKTIESRVPFLRIDYIFGSGHIGYIDYNTIESPYSDQYMIKSKVKFKN